jgi:DNA polymerase-3 subunit epsilon
LLEVLQTDLPISGSKPLKILADKSLTIDLRLWAIKAPFESKDYLKERGYRWHVERKTWYTELSEEALDQETRWLREKVYEHNVFKIEREIIDSYRRFSSRRGLSETVNY